MNKCKNLRNNESGSVVILLALSFVILMGAAGLVIDMGFIYSEKIKLSNALDAAALAGAQELPDKPILAEAVAKDYLTLNGIDPATVTIVISVDHMEMTLTGVETVPHYFLKLLGFNETDVHGKSKIAIGPVSAVKGGLRPFAVEDFLYTYGDLVVLKEDGGDGYHGNYGAVAMGGSGASILKDNAINGYEGTIKIGDILDTEPGNMATVVNALRPLLASDPESFDNHSKKSFRLWTIPIVDSLMVDGRNDVTVTAFAQVFVEDMVNQGGQVEIKARFIRFVVNGDVDFSLADHGAYGVKLTE